MPEPEPTPNEFVEKLKTIDILKAGYQKWNFSYLNQSGNVLTVKFTFNDKAGALEKLLLYFAQEPDILH